MVSVGVDALSSKSGFVQKRGLRDCNLHRPYCLPARREHAGAQSWTPLLTEIYLCYLPKP